MYRQQEPHETWSQQQAKCDPEEGARRSQERRSLKQNQLAYPPPCHLVSPCPPAQGEPAGGHPAAQAEHAQLAPDCQYS